MRITISHMSVINVTVAKNHSSVTVWLISVLGPLTFILINFVINFFLFEMLLNQIIIEGTFIALEFFKLDSQIISFFVSLCILDKIIPFDLIITVSHFKKLRDEVEVVWFLIKLKIDDNLYKICKYNWKSLRYFVVFIIEPFFFHFKHRFFIFVMPWCFSEYQSSDYITERFKIVPPT